MRESMCKTTFKNNIHPRISQWHIQFTGYLNQRWSLNGKVICGGLNFQQATQSIGQHATTCYETERNKHIIITMISCCVWCLFMKSCCACFLLNMCHILSWHMTWYITIPDIFSSHLCHSGTSTKFSLKHAEAHGHQDEAEEASDPTPEVPWANRSSNAWAHRLAD